MSAFNEPGRSHEALSPAQPAALFSSETHDAHEMEEHSQRVLSTENHIDLRQADDQQAVLVPPTIFPTVKTSGFTHLDTAFYSQSRDNLATVGDAQDGMAFRRARLTLAGKAAEFTAYQFEMDFATAGRPSFFDTWVEQGNLPLLGTVRIGQYLQPFSIDAMSGFRNLSFLERSLPFLAFVPFRRVGIMAFDATENDRTHWAYSIFRTGGFNNAPIGDSRFATDIGDVGGFSFSGRLTHLLYYDDQANDRYLWHVGGGYNYSRLGANDAIGSGTPGNSGSPRPFYQARTTPEFGVLGYSELGSGFGSAVNGTPSFVDTGRYAAHDFHLLGVETAYQSGALNLQAEYMLTLVNSVAGPVYYEGGYAEMSYRLTGENRGYDKTLAAFKNPVPFTDFIPLKGAGIAGWGAWSIAARWSFVDLRNPTFLDGHYYDSITNTFSTTNKAGNGLLNDVTLGGTWHLNANTKVQFNWIHAMLENSARGASTADLYVGRVQVGF